MKVNNLVVIGALIVNSMLIGDGLGGLTKAEEIDNRLISKVLPEGYATYEKQLKGDNELNDAHACIGLVSNAKGMLGKVTEKAIEEEDYRRCYCATWRLCLRMRQKSKDSEVKNLILDEWNNGLRKDDEAVAFQIYALAGPLWDRSLITDDFWKLLEMTRRRHTISAICFALYKNGNRKDVERLKQKQESGIDIALQVIIQNALNWMKYRLSGDTSSGPAAIGPTIYWNRDDYQSRYEPVGPKETALLEKELRNKRAVYGLAFWPSTEKLSNAVPGKALPREYIENIERWLPRVLEPKLMPDKFDPNSWIGVRDLYCDERNWILGRFSSADAKSFVEFKASGGDLAITIHSESVFSEPAAQMTIGKLRADLVNVLRMPQEGANNAFVQGHAEKLANVNVFCGNSLCQWTKADQGGMWWSYIPFWYVKGTLFVSITKLEKSNISDAAIEERWPF